MAFAPGERYPSVQALADDVERVLDGHTPEAERASLVTRAARFYVARDPAMARLRVWEIDAWAGGAYLVGIATGGLFARFAARWWWLAGIVGLLIGIPPTIHWLRLLGRKRAP